MPAKPKQRRIMRSFKLNEISAVDTPAQQGARMVLMKRAAPETIEKASALTDSVDGHSHLIEFADWEGRDVSAGMTSHATAEGADEDYGHSHPWIMRLDGTIEIGESRGHTHEVAELSKADNPCKPNGQEDEMTEDEKKALADAQKAVAQVADLTKRLEKAEAESTLNDAARKHYAGLDTENKAAFLAKSADERDAEVREAAELAKRKADADNPVVYKMEDGTEIRKSDGATSLALAKSADRMAKQNAELLKHSAEVVEAARMADLRKRAETDLKFLPGDVDTRVELIKVADGIQDETKREGAFKALKAQNDALGKAFETYGRSGAPGGADDFSKGSPEGQLEAMVKRYAAENSVSEAVAYVKVLDTAEGAAIYDRSIAPQQQH